MKPIEDADFLRLVAFMRDKYGINLENKRQLIDARLSFDIQRRGYLNFSSYVTKVIAEPNSDECRHMVNKLSTNYTFFFREDDFISQLCNTVLPSFLADGKTHFRVWSAACSSGQEAYSIAMVLEQQRNLLGQSFNYELLGTDINTETLAFAAAGVYDAEEYGRIPSKYRQFTTVLSGGAFEVSKQLMRKISWKYENLLSADAVTRKFDVIFCRNVMIYFTPKLRQKMTAMLSAALLPGGYLFTGTTESIDFERRYFRYIAPAFYQKK